MKVVEEDMTWMTVEIVSSYVGNNIFPVEKLPELIRAVNHSLVDAKEAADRKQGMLKPAVPVQRSITYNYIVCLEDGRRLKLLKRHLQNTHGITPNQYRRKWSLPGNYPMTAPTYTAQRSELAKKYGLGRKARPAVQHKGNA